MLGFSFIGLEAGGIRVINLAGTITGAGLMISGAVFVIGEQVVTAIQKGQATREVYDANEADISDGAETDPRDGFLDKSIMFVSFGLVVIIMVGMVILAVTNS